MAAYQIGPTGEIIRASDGASIPTITGNGDYASYLAWVLGGGTADPYVVPTSASYYTIATPVTAGRNMIHNSQFRIWQRGTGTFTTTVYTADRWGMSRGTGGGSGSVTQSALSDTDRSGIGLELARYGLAYTCAGGSAVGDQDALYQRIEDVRRTSNQSVTVSFYAKVTSGTPTLGVNLAQIFGTGGSASTTVYCTAQTFSPTTTWQRFTLAFSVPSIYGKTLGTTANTDFLQLAIALSSGSTNATTNGVGVQSVTGFTIFGVQLEFGSTVTMLEEQDIRYDMANCQRFYQVGQFQVGGYLTTSGGVYVSNAMPTLMRATPTCGIATNSCTNVTSPAVAGAATAIYGSGTCTATGLYIFYVTYTASADL